MKFLINGMDFNVFASLPKADADFLATLESYDKYPLWDYEDFSEESLEFDAMFDEMVLGIEENGAVTLGKDIGSLGKNTAKLGLSVVKTGAAVGAGAVKGVNYGIKGINTGIRWIQTAVRWVVQMGKKCFESTRTWLSGSMGPMLNNLWASFSKFSERWQKLETQSREALGILNTMGALSNNVQIGYHRNFDIHALAAFYHMVENVESFINTYIWIFFNFKYTNLNELVGQGAEGSVINDGSNNQNNNQNNNNQNQNDGTNFNEKTQKFESLFIDDEDKYFDFNIATEDGNVPSKEAELEGVINKEFFQGKTTWIRSSEISKFSEEIGKYFTNGNNGQNVDVNALREFKTRLEAFAQSAKNSSVYGDLTLAYCIFANRTDNNMKLPELDEGWVQNVKKMFASWKSAKTSGTYKMKTNTDAKVDHRMGVNLGLSGAGAYVKTAICGFQDNGAAYVEEFDSGNKDIQRFKQVCGDWLENTTHVTGACANMAKLLKGNAKPITNFTKMLLDGIPDIMRNLEKMSSQLNPGSTHLQNQNTTGTTPPNNNNNNGGGTQTGTASREYDIDAFIDHIISVEDPGVGNASAYANQDANNLTQATDNAGGVSGTGPKTQDAQNAEQSQKLKDIQILFKDIVAGVNAYQTVIQGVCSMYACYVRGFMSAAFEYIIDTENMISGIYRASNNEVNNQMAQVDNNVSLNNNNNNQQQNNNGGNNGN